jgi:hypothetical protein
VTVLFDGDGDARLDEALELERQALQRVYELRGKLTEDDPYRAILERHVGRLESAVNQLEALAAGRLAWLEDT